MTTLAPPEIRFKYSSVDADLMDRLRHFNPRTHVGSLVLEAYKYLPAELANELIVAMAGTVVIQTSHQAIKLASRCYGDVYCQHVYTPAGEKDAWHCPKCGEVWDITDYGINSRHVVTNDGVKNIVDVWNSGGQALNLWKYVGIGTGTGVEAATDSALGAELTTEYVSNNTRATGTISQPSNNVARVVDTNTLDSGTPAVTEAGLFHQAANSGGVLWDRFKFSAINLVGANGDGLQSTINSTFTAGG